jgi:hypothetical protein
MGYVKSSSMENAGRPAIIFMIEVKLNHVTNSKHLDIALMVTNAILVMM